MREILFSDDLSSWQRQQMLRSLLELEERQDRVYKVLGVRGEARQLSSSGTIFHVVYEMQTDHMRKLEIELEQAQHFRNVMAIARPGDMSLNDCMEQWQGIRGLLNQLGWEWQTLVDVLETKLEEKQDLEKGNDSFTAPLTGDEDQIVETAVRADKRWDRG